MKADNSTKTVFLNTLIQYTEPGCPVQYYEFVKTDGSPFDSSVQPLFSNNTESFSIALNKNENFIFKVRAIALNI